MEKIADLFAGEVECTLGISWRKHGNSRPVDQLKIGFPDVDFLLTRLALKVYRIRVAKIRCVGNQETFAVMAFDLDKEVLKRRNLLISETFETRAEAWSVFVHGFLVPSYGVKTKITRLVDHLLVSGEAIEVE